MNLELFCIHGAEEFKGIPMKDYKMREMPLWEFERLVYKCPICGKEIFLKIRVDENET